MATVFLSYRHEDDAHRARVLALAEKLEAAGLSVILDQTYLAANPGGPDEGWPGWSMRNAGQTEKVLIIGTVGWFRCYAGTEVASQGLGSAIEARVIKQRLYDSGGISGVMRVAAFDAADLAEIPSELKGFHTFDALADVEGIRGWVTGESAAAAALAGPSAVALEWPLAAPNVQWFLADCDPVHEAFRTLLTRGTPHRALLIRGGSETGKSHLTKCLADEAIDHPWLVAGRFDLKSAALSHPAHSRHSSSRTTHSWRQRDRQITPHEVSRR